MNGGSKDVFVDLGGGIFVVPVLHERLESAVTVRRALALVSPDAIAVEVPSTLARVFSRAIDRLPAISVLLYENADGETIYLPVHPADPAVEAARWALEHEVPLSCADLDVDGYADHRDPVPDPYAMTRIGLHAYCEAAGKTARPADALDARREAAMAFHVRALATAGAKRILVVVGLRHVEGLAAAVGQLQAAPLTPTVRKNVRLVHLHPESLGEVLGEPPFYVAAYEAQRLGLVPPAAPAEPAASGRDYGTFRVLTGGRGDHPTRVLDAATLAAARAGAPLDRMRLQWALVLQASKDLEAAAVDESIEPWQRRNLARYCGRLARLSGMLVADLYDLVVAGRACVSENFAFELHRLATSYPWQEEAATDLPTARIRAEELWDGVRRVRLKRRVTRRKTRRPESILRRRRRDERFPGEWLTAFDGEAICSYPPEDVIVEAFGGFLRKKGKAVLAEDGSRVVPFTTSVLDGIDVRETIRHWTEKKIYVRESGRTPGDIGIVVVIFDEDHDDAGERYPYKLTWLGEHGQESDMAFYATAPDRAVVGPGICRVTYGGFLLSYPPGRLGDVWTDDDYRFAETKSEVLLLAALDYSRERVVIHVAPKPPRAVFPRNRRSARPEDPAPAHRDPLPGHAEEDPRHARPLRPRKARNRERLPLVVAGERPRRTMKAPPVSKPRASFPPDFVKGHPMDRKYGHKGYQESPRDDRDRDRKHAPPTSPLTPEERAQQRSLRHAVQREANAVMRCPNCGRNVAASGAVSSDTRCPHCASSLHACRACQHFDTGARWECRAPITAVVTDKSKANSCTLFSARLVLDATGKRTGSSGSANDPKSQFDNLFKR